MSKTVEQTVKNIIEHFHQWSQEPDRQNRLIKIEIEDLLKSTTPSPDVAGSDAVAFYKWVKEYREHRESKVKAIDSEPEKKAEFIAMTKLFKEPELLYKIFQSEHPQPAGASVEQADAIWLEHSRMISPDGQDAEEVIEFLQDEADMHGNVHIMFEKDFRAAFQAAQGQPGELEQLRAWKEEAMKVMPDFQKIGQLIGVKLGESVHDKIIPYLEKMQQPAPATVSADRNAFVKAIRSKFFTKQEGYSNEEVVDMLYEAHAILSAPGIPDVRELVEVVSKVASLNDGSGYVGNLEPLRKAAQTALAGIKRK